MSVRPENPPGDSPSASTESTEPRADTPARGVTNRLTGALACAGVGALLGGLAPLFGLVTPRTPAAFLSWPLLLLLAAVPPLLAAGFVRGRPALAAALLIGPAMLAPGRLVLDVQLLVDAGLAARPELLLPHTLEPLTPSVGVWLLLVGHVATASAGVIASFATGGDRSPEPAFGSARSVVDSVREAGGGTRRQGLLAVVLVVAVLVAVGVLMAPFGSDDPYLLPKAAVDSPLPVLLGSLLVAVTVPAAAGFVVSSADPELARGGLVGLALAVAGVVVPPLWAALAVRDLHPGWGAVVGSAGAVLLGLLAVPAGRGGTRERIGEVWLPSFDRLSWVCGVPAVAAGLLAVVGALAPQLDMPPGFDELTPYGARLLLPSGMVLLVLGAAMFVPRLAARVRPALSVAWVVVPLAGTATLDTVLTAVQAAGARAAIGAWMTGFAVLAAALAAVGALLAGGVERDDVDLTELPTRRVLVVPSVLAALLALGAFSFPVLTAPDYAAPGVFTEFGTTSWGLVASLASVLGAVVLVPVCRAGRAAALLSGAALVVLVRVLELPLTAGRAADSGPGPGLWFGLACVVVVVVTAVVAGRRPGGDPAVTGA